MADTGAKIVYIISRVANGDKTTMDRFIWAMFAARLNYYVARYFRPPKKMDGILVKHLLFPL